MKLLNANEIHSLIDSDDADSLFIRPLLDRNQIGSVTVDLRLGYDFAVSVLTRSASIPIDRNQEESRSIKSFFQTTRREIGDKFLLFPGQVALATTLEYVGLPSTVYADVLSRSSYTRLGIHTNTMIQPGFRGCLPLELFNHNNNPVDLVVGSRLVQIRLFEVDNIREYTHASGNRKYYGDVRPALSKANTDRELDKLRMYPSPF